MFYIVHTTSNNMIKQYKSLSDVIDHINNAMTLQQAFTYHVAYSEVAYDRFHSHIICLGSTLHREMFERYK